MMKKIAGALVAFNRACSKRFGEALGLYKRSNYFWYGDDYYSKMLEEQLRQLAKPGMKEPLRVLDIGCGKKTYLSPFSKKTFGYELWGLDISGDEMQNNEFVDHKIVYDATNTAFTRDLAKHAGSFDLVCSHDFLEHVPAPQVTHELVAFLLRPGGAAIHCYPTLYDPTLVLGHLLPTGLASRVLFALEPFRREQGKFTTYYHWCRACNRRVVRRFKDLGLDVIAFKNFYGSRYLYCVFPLQALMDVFYLLACSCGLGVFASHSIVVARKQNAA